MVPLVLIDLRLVDGDNESNRYHARNYVDFESRPVRTNNTERDQHILLISYVI